MGSERHPLVPQTSTLNTEKTPLRRQWELLLDVFSTLGQPMKRVLREHLKQRLFKPAGQRPPSLSKSMFAPGAFSSRKTGNERLA